MKKIILISLLLFIIGCGKGSIDLPINYSMTTSIVADIDGKSLYFLDRKFQNIEIDVSNRNQTIIRIYMIDKFQIGNKIHNIPWHITLYLNESSNFKIIR